MPRVSPEKSSFAQTCNLLSHYLKEKGSLRDLNLGINGEAADTGFSGQASRQVHVNPLNLFPQHASMHDDAISIINSSEGAESEHKNGQMTIFYEGQVLVFDEISSVKAQQVMQLASKSAPQVNTTKMVRNSKSPASGSVQAQNDMKQHWQPIASDLPIARRASLHRFLSKRKDR
ncbi:protein TIFY 10b-like isoform X2 [Daucus carota subsp. sativus]